MRLPGGSHHRERSYMYCWVAALDVLVVALDVLIVPWPTKDDPAFGVFFWFEVTDFDRFLRFFSLCHFIFPSYLFGFVSRCVVSVTPKGN
jgi:hypothetical protein